ncbi:MAG TPA: hypothetical protein VJ782_02190 [Aeromicrobium sp.]|nr:hypothetical protein [Aeromicrobium sp.]
MTTRLYTGHIPPESLPHWVDDGTPLHPEGIPVLVRIYDDGTAEVAVRDTTYGRWLLPAELKEEVSG